MPTLPLSADRAEATGIDELANMRYWKEQRRDPREAMEKPKKDLQRDRRTQSTLSEETQEGALQGEAGQPCQKCQVGVVKAQAGRIGPLDSQTSLLCTLSIEWEAGQARRR